MVSAMKTFMLTRPVHRTVTMFVHCARTMTVFMFWTFVRRSVVMMGGAVVSTRVPPLRLLAVVSSFIHLRTVLTVLLHASEGEGWTAAESSRSAERSASAGFPLASIIACGGTTFRAFATGCVLTFIVSRPPLSKGRAAAAETPGTSGIFVSIIGLGNLDPFVGCIRRLHIDRD